MRKLRKLRKHKGINQQTGKLKKGYKYSGKKLKSGLPQIVKINKRNKRKTQKGGEFDLDWIKKQVELLKKEIKEGGPKEKPYTGVEKLDMKREIKKLTQKYNRSIKIQDELNKEFSDYPGEKNVEKVSHKPNEINA